MSASYFQLTYFQVSLAAALVVLNGLLSYWLQLGLGKRLWLAAIRCVGQLLLVGLVLQWIFAVQQWYVVVALLAVMTAVAGATAVQRARHPYPGLRFNGMISLWASSWLVTAYAVFGIFRFDPWYLPQYVIPVLGMVLGNSLNGVGLAIDRFNEEIVVKREEVETLLALGATRWEAARQPLASAVRVGMLPTLNAMMVAGLVSLPGMMTGQLLAGVSPVEAVKYQIVIMFLLASTTMLASLTVTLLGFRRLFSTRHQLLLPESYR
jgi:putative ABC transport system permease protein